MPLRHFLLVFDIDRQELLRCDEFDDPREAAAAYEGAERRHQSDRRLEIVLVGADSIDTIKRTHSNYFESEADSHYLAAAS